jgi:hypothetical protein
MSFKNYMKRAAEQYQCGALQGTRLWQFRFDKHVCKTANAAPGAGLWVQVEVLGYNDKSGEHEVGGEGSQQWPAVAAAIMQPCKPYCSHLARHTTAAVHFPGIAWHMQYITACNRQHIGQSVPSCQSTQSACTVIYIWLPAAVIATSSGMFLKAARDDLYMTVSSTSYDILLCLACCCRCCILLGALLQDKGQRST